MAFVNFKPMLHTTFVSVLWMFSPAWKDHFTDITAGTVVTFLSEMKPHSGPFPHLLHHCFVWRLWCSLFAICGCQKNIWGCNSRSLSVAISMVLFCRDIRFVITKDKEKNQILTVTRLKSEKRCPQFERNTTVVNKYPRSVTIRQAWCTRSKRVCNAAIRAETTETPFTPLQSTWLWSCYFKVLKKRYVMLL